MNNLQEVNKIFEDCQKAMEKKYGKQSLKQYMDGLEKRLKQKSQERAK